MRTHLGCTGSVELGTLSEETQHRLEQLDASWLEFAPESQSLVVRHVQPDDVPVLREIAGELLEFLSVIAEAERVKIPGGAIYSQDEVSGQYVRLKVWAGGFLTVAWARPDYEHATLIAYHGQTVPVVFEPYQRLNGVVRFENSAVAAEVVRATLERSEGLYAQGEYAINVSMKGVEITLRDVNASVLPLVRTLRDVAVPGSLQGEIDVSSFRAGDLEDYCRFVFRNGEAWLVRPSLWSDLPEKQAPPSEPLERAA
ncbi:MAG: hypothetical protein LAP13_12620 [Acidobacteriia bacterium]|nr:hypothetical protein [Terriglobia bacterium]